MTIVITINLSVTIIVVTDVDDGNSDNHISGDNADDDDNHNDGVSNGDNHVGGCGNDFDIN